jgi:hypothetical protein
MRIRVFTVTFLLFGLIIMFQSPHAFAGTYDSTWIIFRQGDTQKRPFAELQVVYSQPNTAKAGKTFAVNVSLTYLKNDKSYITSIQLYGVAVNIRQSPTSSNVASDTDNSRMTLKPGDRYTHKFTLTAPTQLGEYFVVLVWKTYHPLTTAYGMTMDEGELDYDTGQGNVDNLPKITVVKAEVVLTLRLQNLPSGTVLLDGRETPVTGGVLEVPLEGQHTIEVPAQVDLGAGARAAFDKWSDGVATNLRQLTIQDDLDLTAIYKKQYLLNFVGNQGNPQGEGWYDAGSQATISVTSPQPDSLGALGGKLVFEGWTGDVTTDSPTATVTMNGPKTVKPEWRTDDSQAYMILGGIVAAFAVILAVFLLRRRGTQTSRMPAMPTPQMERVLPPPPPPTAAPRTARPPLSKGVKYCVHCGAVIPSVVTFCTKCGKKQ